MYNIEKYKCHVYQGKNNKLIRYKDITLLLATCSMNHKEREDNKLIKCELSTSYHI